MAEEKIIYYSDELNDEFAGDNIKARVIDENYKYIHKSLWKKITHIFWLRMVAWPLAVCYLKHRYHHKIINKKVLKENRKKGYYMYGNHTHNLCDALIPAMVNGWKSTYVIVHPNNVSMPVLGAITPSLGAYPLPDGIKATKNFTEGIEYHIAHKDVMMIYPEAHIWPYYTKIRPFKDASFRYPVNDNAPVYCFTNVYTKRKHSKHPKITTYVGGPFYPDETLSRPEARKKLRNQVYDFMCEKAKLNNVELIKYVKKEEAND